MVISGNTANQHPGENNYGRPQKLKSFWTAFTASLNDIHRRSLIENNYIRFAVYLVPPNRSVRVRTGRDLCLLESGEYFPPCSDSASVTNNTYACNLILRRAWLATQSFTPLNTATMNQLSDPPPLFRLIKNGGMPRGKESEHRWIL